MAVLALLIMGCSQSGGGGSSNGPALQGTDMSGSWRMTQVSCFDSSFENVTASATIAAGSATSTATINKNTLVEESFGTGGCRVNFNRSAVFNIVEGDRSGGYGTGSFGATNAEVTTGASCSGTVNLTVTQGSMTPTTFTSTYTNGQSVAARDFEFLTTSTTFAMPSLIQVDGSPTDICLLIYQKL